MRVMIATYGGWGVLLLILTGCGPTQVSPVTYQYTKAIYSVCNRQAAEQLENVEHAIEQERRAGRMSDREAQRLQAILDQGGKGDWQAAAQQARQIMLEQVSQTR